MPEITIDIPEHVLKEMVRRGAKRNQTAEEYIAAGLIHDARYPTVDDLLEAAENRALGRFTAEQTLEVLREDRASH